MAWRMTMGILAAILFVPSGLHATEQPNTNLPPDSGYGIKTISLWSGHSLGKMGESSLTPTAAKYHIALGRVGIIGFSTGGHLAATASTLFDAGDPSDPDPANRVSDRPDFMILGYAWFHAMEPNNNGKITYCFVLKTVPKTGCKKFEKSYTPALHATAKTQPTFIYATSDDRVVPAVQASVDFYDALVAAGMPVEMHLFAYGPHGSGLSLGHPTLDLWPVLPEAWLHQLGFFAARGFTERAIGEEIWFCRTSAFT